MQAEYMRVRVLSDLVRQAPQGLLSELWETMLAITHKPSQANVLSDFLPRLPLATLPYSDWKAHLHLLAYRKRSELMKDLGTLYLAILHLGGKTAMRGVVDAMREVCSQWK